MGFFFNLELFFLLFFHIKRFKAQNFFPQPGGGGPRLCGMWYLPLTSQNYHFFNVAWLACWYVWFLSIRSLNFLRVFRKLVLQVLTYKSVSFLAWLKKKWKNREKFFLCPSLCTMSVRPMRQFAANQVYIAPQRTCCTNSKSTYWAHTGLQMTPVQGFIEVELEKVILGGVFKSINSSVYTPW